MDWSVVSQKNFGWGLNNGNPYVASVNSTRDGVTTRVEQSLDVYGNQTQQKVFNTDLVAANGRVYNYTYYSNRLASATLTAGGQT